MPLINSHLHYISNYWRYELLCIMDRCNLNDPSLRAFDLWWCIWSVKCTLHTLHMLYMLALYHVYMLALYHVCMLALYHVCYACYQSMMIHALLAIYQWFNILQMLLWYMLIMFLLCITCYIFQRSRVFSACFWSMMYALHALTLHTITLTSAMPAPHLRCR